MAYIIEIMVSSAITYYLGNIAHLSSHIVGTSNCYDSTRVTSCHIALHIYPAQKSIFKVQPHSGDDRPDLLYRIPYYAIPQYTFTLDNEHIIDIIVLYDSGPESSPGGEPCHDRVTFKDPLSTFL
jgi:hypothetical protein